MLHFKKTPIKTIIMAISRSAITAIIIKMVTMAIMAHRDMAIIMVLMDVFFKYSKNEDHSQKRCSKISMQ